MQLRRGLVPAQMVPEWLPDGWTGSFLNMAVFWNTCSHRAQQARLNLLPSAGAREIGRCSPLSCAGGLCAAPTGQSQRAVRAGPGGGGRGAASRRGGALRAQPFAGRGAPRGAALFPHRALRWDRRHRASPRPRAQQDLSCPLTP